MSEDGGSAFPVVGFDTRGGQGFDSIYSNGMSLRDWFAGMALQGLVNAALGNGAKISAQDYANTSYELADAMLKER